MTHETLWAMIMGHGDRCVGNTIYVLLDCPMSQINIYFLSLLLPVSPMSLQAKLSCGFASASRKSVIRIVHAVKVSAVLPGHAACHQALTTPLISRTPPASVGFAGLDNRAIQRQERSGSMAQPPAATASVERVMKIVEVKLGDRSYPSKFRQGPKRFSW